MTPLPRRLLTPLLLLALGLPPAAPAASPVASGAPPATYRPPEILLSAPPGAPETDRAREILERAGPELFARLNLALPERLSVELLDDRADFRRAAWPDRLSDSTVGFAEPLRARIVILLPALREQSDGSLLAVTRHELCHVALGHFVRGSAWPLPRWFDEGLATRFGGRIYARLSADDPLGRAYYGGRIIPFAQLARDFPSRDEDALHLAYQQSEDFLSYLIERAAGDPAAGERRLRLVLADLAAGTRLEEAVELRWGRSLPVLEYEWRQTLRRTLGLPGAVLNSLSIFTLLALLALVAFGVYLWRRRAVRRRLAAAERPAAPEVRIMAHGEWEPDEE